ncbi:MAG: DMT family transporter [Treponema sp.]|nr:DMT family transporter [Treponema sp.]
MQLSTASGVLSLVFCALLWSTGGVLVKLVDWNPFAIAGTRSLIGLITVCLMLRRLPSFIVRDEKNGKTDLRGTLYVYIAAACYAGTMILYIVANKLTTAANAILLEYTDPIYIIMFGPLILGEKNRKSDYVTVAGVVLGMVLFFADGLRGGRMAGNLIAALSGTSWGFCTIYMRKLTRRGSQDAFMLSHIITFLVGVPFIFIYGFPSGSVIVSSGIGLLLLGIFQIGIPSILYACGIGSVRALSASFISMIEPLMNPVWVLLFMGEVPSVWTCTGGVVILGCIIGRELVQRRRGIGKK